MTAMAGCTKIQVFEKHAIIPNHKWDSHFKPSLEFDIEDTTAGYNIFIVLRHTNAYSYNNIWLKGSVIEPGSNKPNSQQYDILLADNTQGWLGDGMDDIFEHRILIQPRTRFPRKGKYQFQIQHVMREDPLPNIMNVGLRIEKAQ